MTAVVVKPGAAARRFFRRAARANPGLRWLLSILVVIALSCGPLAAQQVPSPPERRPNPPSQQTKERLPEAPEDEPAATYRVNVRLVNVFATVTDANGAPVANLQKENFRLFEDGQAQTISVFERESSLPLSIVLAIDASLSTRKDLPLELQAARRFAHSVVRPVDAVALYQFSRYVTEMVPFTANLRRLDRGIGQIRSHSSTALYDALYLGSKALISRQGRKVLVVITDGGDTASTTSYQEAVRAAQTAEAIVYSVIMVPVEASAGRDLGGEHALIQISHDTGGKHYYASDDKGLEDAFRQISEELRTQYMLGYYPAERVGSDFRRLRLEVTPAQGDGGLIVRHRAGYYVSKLE